MAGIFVSFFGGRFHPIHTLLFLPGTPVPENPFTFPSEKAEIRPFEVEFSKIFTNILKAGNRTQAGWPARPFLEATEKGHLPFV